MVKEGAPKREGTEGLQALTPRQQIPIQPSQIVTDPNTGKKVINLTVEDAITKMLANSPEIRVINIDPEISKQDITKAVADFDVISFGQVNYQNNDNPNNNKTVAPTITEGGLSTNKLFQAGLKQKLITGSEWSFAWQVSRSWDNSDTTIANPSYTPMLALQLKQPILRDAWRKFNYANINLSRLNYRVALAAFRQKIEDASVRVIGAYWTLLKARQNLEIQQRLLERTAETLQKVKARKDIDATSAQVNQAQSSYDSRLATLYQTQKDVNDAQDTIALFLADPNLNILNNSMVLPVSRPDQQQIAVNTTDALQIAMKRNPLLLQSRLKVEIAQINIDIAENQKLPRLDLVASTSVQGFANTEGNAYDSLFDTQFNSYVVGVSFEYPLGNRERLAELRKRQLAHTQAVASMQSTSDQVANAVKERARAIETAYNQLQAQSSAANTARVYLQALEDTESIRGKLSPEYLLTKLQAQESLANARRAEIQAIVDFNNALVQLAQAQGTVLEMHQIQMSVETIASDPAK